VVQIIRKNKLDVLKKNTFIFLKLQLENIK